MKSSLFAFLIVLLVVFTSENFAGTYAGGQGTAEDPYQISTSEELQEVGANPLDWNMHFKLTADIDIAGQTYTSAFIAPDIDSSSDAFQGTAFTGVFDGNGFSVSNFVLSTSAQNSFHFGFFGYLGGSGQIMNLKLKDVNVISKYNWFVSGLVGQNHGEIFNCTVTGVVDGGIYVGGIVGKNYGSLKDCLGVCTVSGHDFGGGLVGFNQGVITQCCAIGTVCSSYDAGGLVGGNYKGAFENCFSTGVVSGFRSVGGLAGSNDFGEILNCYSDNDVYGNSNVGGFAGSDYYGIYNGCFWNKEVNSSLEGIGDLEDAAGVTGMTVLEMQSESTFVEAGWDFDGETENGIEDIWCMQECGRPVLSWQQLVSVPDVSGLSEVEAKNYFDSLGIVFECRKVHSTIVPAGNVILQIPPAGCEAAVVRIFVSDGFPYEAGEGTWDEPYQIWTAEQLDAIGRCPGDWDKEFILKDDIDLSDYSGSEFNIIGRHTNPFHGFFDGNGHVVSNFKYTTSDVNYVGLFGCVGLGGWIRNLGLKDIDLDANYYVGGLAGGNYGVFHNCYVAGDITGHAILGGFAGENYGRIRNCYSLTNVSGHEFAGGLIGINDGSVRRCYSAGSVVGHDFFGGFVGESYREANYISCFWDIDLNTPIAGSGNGYDPDGVMGETTAYMHMKGLYTYHSWGFDGEYYYGFEDVWRMCAQGVEYPRLRWEFDSVGDFECPDGVGVEDVGYFARCWLSPEERADMNDSGRVDMFDFVLFADWWVGD